MKALGIFFQKKKQKVNDILKIANDIFCSWYHETEFFNHLLALTRISTHQSRRMSWLRNEIEALQNFPKLGVPLGIKKSFKSFRNRIKKRRNDRNNDPLNDQEEPARLPDAESENFRQSTEMLKSEGSRVNEKGNRFLFDFVIKSWI